MEHGKREGPKDDVPAGNPRPRKSTKIVGTQGRLHPGDGPAGGHLHVAMMAGIF